MTPARMEVALRTEVDRALAREAAITDEYWTLLEKLTRDDPTPEELDRLVIAGRSKNAARQALWDALSRLDGFRARGMASEQSQMAAA